jgi:hypothetical protein
MGNRTQDMQVFWKMVIGNNSYETAMMWEAPDNESNFRIQQILILINRDSNAFMVLWAANM